MAQHKSENFSTPEEQSISLSAHGVPGENSHLGKKPLTDWEQPDFDELDLCMEITTYIYHWQ